MMKVMKHNNKVMSGYLVSNEGRVFYGKDRVEVKPFLKNGTYYFNIVVNKKLVSLNGLELVLGNFEEKPKDGNYKAEFKTDNYQSSLPLHVDNLAWKKSNFDCSTNVNVDLKKMKSVFINGILTNHLISREGKVYTLQGKEVKPKISRRGRPFIEVPMPYNMGIQQMFLSDMVINAYKLPPKDFLINYHQSFLDGDKKNCAENNIVLWKDGHAGIARKKLVKVFKDGKFFGAFESVKKCSSVINIPRRRISELLKNGVALNGFMVQEFKMW